MGGWGAEKEFVWSNVKSINSSQSETETRNDPEDGREG